MPGKWLTLAEIERVTGIARETLIHHITSRTSKTPLKATKIGVQWLVREKDLATFLALRGRPLTGP